MRPARWRSAAEPWRGPPAGQSERKTARQINLARLLSLRPGVSASTWAASVLARRKLDEIFQRIGLGAGRLPVRFLAEQGVLVAEHQPQENAGNDSSTHGTQLRRRDDLAALDRNSHLLLEVHGLRQNIRPQGTIALERRPRDADDIAKTRLGVIHALTD